jgi:hypothetical protein
MNPRLATLGALAAIATMAAGCAGASGGPASSASPTPGGRSGSARAVAIRSPSPTASAWISKARLVAFARAVNLTAADVPGAQASASRREPPDHEPAHCGEVGNAHELGNVRSPKLIRGTGLEREEIHSAVALMSSTVIAARDVASARSTGVRACYARILRERFAGRSFKGARVANVSLSPLPVPAPGSDGSAGLRFAVSITPAHSETSIPIYFDLLAFTLGPVEVSLQALSAIQPEPPTTERQLVLLLVDRAEAYRR